MLLFEGDPIIKEKALNFFKACGAYGTRTRDPMRDRHVF